MQPMTELKAESLRDYYRRFAELEANGSSATYSAWARGVAKDDEVISRLLELPKPKRQANLLFAAARHCAGARRSPDMHATEKVGTLRNCDYATLRTWLLEHWEETRELMLARSTQTNEAGRCAVLLPALAAIDGPISLIEVGASAGLCLYPDRYSYEYRSESGTIRLDPADGPSPAVLSCEFLDSAPPTRIPEVAWRAGIDLNPLDVADPDEREWLKSLVWPEHEARRERLSAAAGIVETDPPRLISGDLCDRIEPLIAEAPSDSQIVVFHSAVLAYLDAPKREDFAAIMRAHPEVVWLSNEGAGVLPETGAQLDARGVDPAGRFVLSVNGIATALTGPHGQSYEELERS
ncbi:MAG: DUF2332 domain-containing protein [Brevibacterium sp.]